MIRVNPFFAKIFLFLNPFNCFKLVCKGYDEDFDNYTELVRKDDIFLNFSQDNYFDFQIWKTK